MKRGRITETSYEIANDFTIQAGPGASANFVHTFKERQRPPHHLKIILTFETVANDMDYDFNIQGYYLPDGSSIGIINQPLISRLNQHSPYQECIVDVRGMHEINISMTNNHGADTYDMFGLISMDYATPPVDESYKLENRPCDVFKYMDNTFIGNSTIWTPRATYRFCLRGFTVSVSAATILLLEDGVGNPMFGADMGPNVPWIVNQIHGGRVSTTRGQILNVVSTVNVRVIATVWGHELPL